eukprot:scaffold1868_cov194-Alexandrium_tamarense.AAC.12
MASVNTALYSPFNDDQEGFIDVDVDSEHNENGIAVVVEGASPDEPLPPKSTQQLLEPEEDGQFEMSPLMLSDDIADNDEDSNINTSAASDSQHVSESAAAPKPHMRSRRKAESGTITDYGDDDDDANVTNQSIQRSCLRKKRSWGGNGATTGPLVDEGMQRMDVLDYSTTNNNESNVSGGASAAIGCGRVRRFCRDSSQHYLVRTTVSVMNLLSRILLWGSFVAMVVGVVWYSRELKMNG